jgi:ABC-type bacteriocin/lantibiotic exporter with double-glycine peptidase domain
MQRKNAVSAAVVACMSIFVAACWMLKVVTKEESARLADLETSLGTQGKGDPVLQDRLNNCGPAVLQMVLSHFGVEVPLRRLEQETRLSVRGASLQMLEKVAELHGLRAEGWRLGWGDLRRARLPIIIFLKDGHFAVVDSVDTEGFVHLRDPSIGRVKMVRERLMEKWGGESMIFTLGLTSNTTDH